MNYTDIDGARGWTLHDTGIVFVFETSAVLMQTEYGNCIRGKQTFSVAAIPAEWQPLKFERLTTDSQVCDRYGGLIETVMLTSESLWGFFTVSNCNWCDQTHQRFSLFMYGQLDENRGY